MKKMMAIILSLAILLCAAAATAENAEKVTIGTISINGAFRLQCGIPEGYTPVPEKVTPEQVTAVIKSEDPNAPVMALSVAYDEMYSDVDRLNALSQEWSTSFDLGVFGDNTDAKLDEYISLLKEAGYEQLLEACKTQLKDYLAQ